MIIDSNGMDCQAASFFIGGSTSTTRSWDIYVTQYTCGQEDLAGPPGCLQYHTGSTGLVKTFGYGTSNTNAATATSTTHLQNQNYNVSSLFVPGRGKDLERKKAHLCPELLKSAVVCASQPGVFVTLN